MQTSYNVIAYKDKPRLRTALEMLRITQELENRLQEVWNSLLVLLCLWWLCNNSEFIFSLQVSLPILIVHGEADIVTDPSVSKALYEKANSKDKKLCLYKDSYHSLLEGEPDEMIFRILDDIISWLDEHCIKAGTSQSIPPWEYLSLYFIESSIYIHLFACSPLLHYLLIEMKFIH